MFYAKSRSEIVISGSENVISGSVNIIFSSPIIISGSEIDISGSLYLFKLLYIKKSPAITAGEICDLNKYFNVVCKSSVHAHL